VAIPRGRKTSFARGALLTALMGAVLLLVPLSSGSTVLRSGSLDPTFGSHGVVVVKASPGGGRVYDARAIALQPDKRIVVAGLATTQLARFNPNGSPDASFGEDGFVSAHVAAYAMVLEKNGKIVIGGVGGHGQFALARFRGDGSPDTSFGTAGEVDTSIGAGATLYALVVRPDGKIVAAGSASDGNNGEVALAQYKPDGSLDSTFGHGGTLMTDLCGDAYAAGVVIQPNGKIVAAGGVYYGPHPAGCGHTGCAAAVLRYNPDGSLDPSFGTEGRALTHFEGCMQGYDVALAPHRRILVAGDAHAFALARYNADGSLDQSFGKSGKVVAGSALNAFAVGVAIAPDGKIVAVGGAEPSGQEQGAALARFEHDGRLDRSFGRKGFVTTHIPGWRLAEADAVALQPNGKIDVAGEVMGDTSEAPWLIARYLGAKPCVVPRLTGKTLRVARRKIRGAGCSTGRLRMRFATMMKGRVISQRPRPGRHLRARAKVSLVVSKGKRH
jgi:uncharacterized delta-60 repeat protein